MGITAQIDDEGVLVIRIPIRIEPANARPHNFQFTRQEQATFDLLRKGKTNKEIASALGISERTAKFHVSGVMARTGCSSRGEVIFKFASDIASE